MCEPIINSIDLLFKVQSMQMLNKIITQTVYRTLGLKYGRSASVVMVWKPGWNEFRMSKSDADKLEKNM